MAGEDIRQGEAPKRTRRKAKEPTQAPAVVGDDVQKAENREHHRQDRAERRRWLPENVKPAEWIMIVFTAITAVAAWAGVLVANRQAKLGADQLAFAEKSAADSGRDTRDALKISNRLAETAETQARIASAALELTRVGTDIAKRNLQSSLQTEVTFYSKPLDGVAVGQSPKTLVVIENGGQRQISNIRSAAILLAHPPDEDIFRHGAALRIGPMMISTVAAGQHREWPLGTNVKLNEAALNDLKSDRYRIYVYGFATYDDGTGHHRRNFCAAYFGENLSQGLACKTPPDK